MNKAIMISVKPKFCRLIASGKKTVEIRKTRPKIETPFKCYIYCTKPSKAHQTVSGCMVFNSDELYRHPKQGIKYGDSIELMCFDADKDYTADNFLNGKVIGEFVCDRILTVDCDSVAPFDRENSEYLEKECCLNRDEFWKYSDGCCCCWGFHISDLVIYDKPKILSEFRKPLTCHRGIQRDNCDGCWDCEIKRPPQSWCYVEEIEEEEHEHK